MTYASRSWMKGGKHLLDGDCLTRAFVYGSICRLVEFEHSGDIPSPMFLKVRCFMLLGITSGATKAHPGKPVLPLLGKNAAAPNKATDFLLDSWPCEFPFCGRWRTIAVDLIQNLLILLRWPKIFTRSPKFFRSGKGRPFCLTVCFMSTQLKAKFRLPIYQRDSIL